MPDVHETEQSQVEEQPKPAARAADGPDITQLVIKASAIAAVALVAVLAAFIVTTKVLKPMLASDPPTQEELLAAAEAEKAKAEESKGHGGGHGEEGGDNLLFEIEQIIVNPASTVGSRFLSCSVAFEVADSDALSAFESDEIKIRDALITILTSRTVDELADPRMREPLRRQILARVNKITEPAEANAVYFKDFVLQ